MTDKMPENIWADIIKQPYRMAQRGWSEDNYHNATKYTLTSTVTAKLEELNGLKAYLITEKKFRNDLADENAKLKAKLEAAEKIAEAITVLKSVRHDHGPSQREADRVADEALQNWQKVK